jgi:hypothetical protein
MDLSLRKIKEIKQNQAYIESRILEMELRLTAVPDKNKSAEEKKNEAKVSYEIK